MRKLSVIAIVGLATLFLFVSIAFAGADNQPKTDHSDYWQGVWQEFKNDWKAIGAGFKETGTNMGHAFRNEFREMPENVRQGCKETKSDFQTFIGSGPVNSTPPK